MARIIGLDLGARAVRAVLIRSSVRSHTIAGWHVEPLDAAARAPAFSTSDDGRQEPTLALPSMVEPPVAASVPPDAAIPETVTDPSSSISDVAEPVDALAPRPSPEDPSPLASDSPPAPAEPLSWTEKTAAALDRLMASTQWTADSVVVALPGAQVATHVVSLPFGDLRRVEQALPFELEELLPFEADEVVWDWQAIRREESRTEVLACVARRPEVEAVIALLAARGLDPSTVTFSALELSHLAQRQYLDETPAGERAEPSVVVNPAAAAESARLEALLDLGATRADLVLLRDDQPVLARTLAFSGEQLERSIARTLGVDPALVRERLAQPESAEPLSEQLIEAALVPLARELRTVLAGFHARARTRVQRIRFGGGGALVPGLCALLERQLGVPVDVASFRKAHALPDCPRPQPLMLATALALRGLAGDGGERINLRQGSLARVDASAGWGRRMRPLLAMASVLALLWGGTAWARLNTLEKREAAMDTALCDATQQILGNCETDYRVALGKLKGRGTAASAIPAVSALDLLGAVVRQFPPDKNEATLDELDVVESTLTLKGNARDFKAIESLSAALKQEPCFDDVRTGNTTKGKDERIQFQLSLHWGCKGRTPPGESK